MKRFALFVLVGVVALAAARDRLTFRDSKKDPHVQIEGDNGFFIPDKSFELTGKVIIQQLKDKFTLTCDKATGELGKINGSMEFNKVHLTGSVTATQVGEKSSFAASGSKADYSLNESSRELAMSGGVNIDFSGSSEVKPSTPGKALILRNSAMNVKASNTVINFKKVMKEKKEVIEVQTATVEGPIDFHGTQTDKSSGKTTNQKFSAKADKMTYAIKGESGEREVKLTGNLEIHQADDNGDGPDITGARTLVLQLDDQFNIVKVRFSSDGAGQIKTVFTKSRKGGH